MKAVIIGATGAVGTALLRALVSREELNSVVLLVRRKPPKEAPFDSLKVSAHVVDLLDPSTYRQYLEGSTLAFSTLGAGQPSKVSREELYKADLETVKIFAEECKNVGCPHFAALVSAGADPKSSVYYLKVKGLLEEAIAEMGFIRTSFFEPSMIITPKNRYGLLQGVLLRVFPMIDPMLAGPLSLYRSISVDRLGHAMALDAISPLSSARVQHLRWKDFEAILARTL